MNNVVKMYREKTIPSDLMSFKEVYQKYNIKYQTLYKYTRILCEIPVYTKGGLKISEKDLINWMITGYKPIGSNK